MEGIGNYQFLDAFIVFIEYKDWRFCGGSYINRLRRQKIDDIDWVF
jgi:hypothetical protein